MKSRLATYLILLLAILLGACATPRVPHVISWRAATEHVGKRMIVEGIVIATRRTERAVFLNFSENWQRDFTVVIFNRDFGKWPQADPETPYRQKKIRVRGKIERYRDRVEIVVARPDQIEIIE